MIAIIFNVFLSGVIGALLTKAGIGTDNWIFWAILVISLVQQTVAKFE